MPCRTRRGPALRAEHLDLPDGRRRRAVCNQLLLARPRQGHVRVDGDHRAQAAGGGRAALRRHQGPGASERRRGLLPLLRQHVGCHRAGPGADLPPVSRLRLCRRDHRRPGRPALPPRMRRRLRLPAGHARDRVAQGGPRGRALHASPAQGQRRLPPPEARAAADWLHGRALAVASGDHRHPALPHRGPRHRRRAWRIHDDERSSAPREPARGARPGGPSELEGCHRGADQPVHAVHRDSGGVRGAAVRG